MDSNSFELELIVLRIWRPTSENKRFGSLAVSSLVNRSYTILGKRVGPSRLGCLFKKIDTYKAYKKRPKAIFGGQFVSR